MPSSSDSKKSILLVEDDVEFAGLLKAAIEPKGYMVVTASDGHQALSMIKQQAPDIIISDLTMPDMDGWRLSQVLRNSQQYKPYQNIPIIILSGLVQKEGPPDEYEMGDYYLSKPFDLTKLLSTIQALLEKNP